MRSKVFTLCLLVCAAAGLPAVAQTKPMSTITTAVPFLRIAADARGAGMGDLGVSTMADASSHFYNIGKAAFAPGNSGINLSYSPWLQALDRDNSYFLAMSGFTKIGGMETISGGIRYLKQGEFSITDDMGTQTSTFSPSDLAIDAGYSRKLSAKTGAGISLRYIHSKLTDNSGDYKAGNSVAADFGFFFAGKTGAGTGWDFGVALTNLGSKMGYTSSGIEDFIPANLGLGTTYSKTFNADNRFSFGLELNKLLVPTPPEASDVMGNAEYREKGVVGSWFRSFGDAPGGFSEEIKEFQLGIGTEYTYNEMFSMRLGYFGENENKGYRKYVTLGAGMRYQVAALNFSYLVAAGSGADDNPLKNTFRLSLQFDFQTKKVAK